jgi:hypothetical protein
MNVNVCLHPDKRFDACNMITSFGQMQCSRSFVVLNVGIGSL